QQVVEVVRDSSGQLPHGLHLLRLPQLLFELPALGDVAQQHDVSGQPVVACADGCDAGVEHALARARDPRQVDAARLAATFAEAGQQLVDDNACSGGPASPDERRGGAVDVGDASTRVEDD